MPSPVIVEGGTELLDDIKPLWEELNRHHANISSHFSDYFKNFTFENRKASIEAKAHRGTVRIFFAKVDGLIAGQCVVSLMPELLGEIDSIFVAEEFRDQKIGDSLMQVALNWLDSSGAKSKTVVVVHGNESANTFYARYGFMPRSNRLSQL